MKQAIVIVDGKRTLIWKMKQICENCKQEIRNPIWKHRIQKFCCSTCKMQWHSDKAKQRRVMID